MMSRMQNMDVFFITYDEPQKDLFWEAVKAQIPFAQRVDGVKGFNRAHRECAERARTLRFFTIDGDNVLHGNFSTLKIPMKLIVTTQVLSWSAKNSINGLAYGNGGVKNWPREVAIHLKSHEESSSLQSAVDFCFDLNYYQMPDTLSTSHIHSTPLQAFRAGFREGVKMSLDRGFKVEFESQNPVSFVNALHISNLERLKIWCSVGADVPNGLWAIFGARLGLYEFYFNQLPLESIRDYDWFDNYWKENFAKKAQLPANDFLTKEIEKLGTTLNQKMNLGLQLLSPESSEFFKSVYFNRPRQGPMFAES
jgi:hypothetical protein